MHKGFKFKAGSQLKTNYKGNKKYHIQDQKIDDYRGICRDKISDKNECATKKDSQENKPLYKSQITALKMFLKIDVQRFIKINYIINIILFCAFTFIVYNI